MHDWYNDMTWMHMCTDDEETTYGYNKNCPSPGDRHLCLTVKLCKERNSYILQHGDNPEATTEIDLYEYISSDINLIWHWLMNVHDYMLREKEYYAN